MSDIEKYRDLFVQEARDHLEALSLGLLRLESGFDREAVDALFRAAHSIKGMAATLGFSAEAGLAHAMEDHLDRIREQGTVALQVVEVLLDANDALGTAVDAIEARGSTPGLAGITERLRALTDADAEAIGGGHFPSAGDASTPAPPLMEAWRRMPHEARIWVSLQLASDCLAPRARLLVLRRTIESVGRIAHVDPPEAEWKQIRAADRRTITFLVTGTADERTLHARVETVPDVANVTVATTAPAGSDPPTRAASTISEGAPDAAAPAPRAAAAGPTPSAPTGERRPATAFAGGTVRMPVDRIDALLDLTGELRIAQSQLARILEGMFIGRRPHVLTEALRRVERETKSLYGATLDLRTLPVSLVTGRLPRLVRDLARRHGKEVRLEIQGQDTQIDRSVLETLGDPLVHLVKNAVDHGLEDAVTRRAAGKDPEGTVRVRFERGAGSIHVLVADDGTGIDRDRVAQIALERGLISATEADTLSERAIHQLIAAPGFSTARKVTQDSGRGVGLDAVKAEIERVGGTMTIRGRSGHGTSVRLTLPPTLALVEALEVEIDSDPYYVPVEAIITSVPVSPQELAQGHVQVRDPRHMAEPDAGESAPARADHGAATPPRTHDPGSQLADLAASIPEIPVRLAVLHDVLGLKDRPFPYVLPETESIRVERLQARLGANAAPGRGADLHNETSTTVRVRGDGWRRPDLEYADPWKGEESPIALVVEKDAELTALVVDGVRQIREVVVKAIQGPAGAPRFVSGATIQGDGRVALILDVPSVLDGRTGPTGSSTPT